MTFPSTREIEILAAFAVGIGYAESGSAWLLIALAIILIPTEWIIRGIEAARS